MIAAAASARVFTVTVAENPPGPGWPGRYAGDRCYVTVNYSCPYGHHDAWASRGLSH
jgi:hypothetical protein